MRKLLTEKENGIKTLIDKITERIVEKEQKAGRELSLKEIIMTVLDEFSSITYII